MIASPTNLLFHSKTSMEAIDAVRGYVSAVNHIPGILDSGGEYRFYYLKDLENGRLPHGPRINLAGPVHGCVSLRALLSGTPSVQPLENQQGDQQTGHQDVAGVEVVDSPKVPNNLTMPQWPPWIQHLWENTRDQGVAAAKEIWLDRQNYFKWPEASRVLSNEWIRVANPDRTDLYEYPPDIVQECEALGIQADGRSNGPAIVAFRLAGGTRPFRKDPPNWGWSIHHIYDGKFPAPHQQCRVLNAVQAAGEFTNSCGLVAAHPVADFVAANSPLLAWLLRLEAFRRFNYDPDRIFLAT